MHVQAFLQSYMHKRKCSQYTQSVIRTIVTDLVYEEKKLEIMNALQVFCLNSLNAKCVDIACKNVLISHSSMMHLLHL